jgi:hypothetical protein
MAEASGVVNVWDVLRAHGGVAISRSHNLVSSTKALAGLDLPTSDSIIGTLEACLVWGATPSALRANRKSQTKRPDR